MSSSIPRQIEAPLYRKFYEDDDWWTEHFSDYYVDGGVPLYDDSGAWIQTEPLTEEDVGVIVHNISYEESQVSVFEAFYRWLESRELSEWTSVALRIDKARAPAILEALRCFDGVLEVITPLSTPPSTRSTP